MKITILVLISLLLFSCSNSVEENKQQVKTYHLEAISEITLESGLECLIYQRTNKGGITCNWEKYNASH